MAFSILKKEIINYPPENLRGFKVNMYEWIDNLNFTINPIDCLDNPEDYLVIAKEMFLKSGWNGDGEIQLMWIPPFLLERNSSNEPDFTNGLVFWHVKQQEDGISWILSSIDLF
jgi:hypothetical protein